MRWQDQSETPALPPMSDFMATLSAADRAHLRNSNQTVPRVVIGGACLKAMYDHVALSEAELGGLIVGRAYAAVGCQDAALVVAEHAVASRTSDSTGVSLRMETEVWDRARPYLDAGALVLGWYHSHPDLGAFFSLTDRETHRHFFRGAYSLGIVIDPVRQELGAFLGPACVQIPSGNLLMTGAPAEIRIP
jgi:proteasome lid subunit RPN8/RPN11